MTCLHARLIGLAGLVGVLILASARADAQTSGSLCGPAVHAGEDTGVVVFPQDQIFCRLLADPKEPRSFVSLLRGTFPSIDAPRGRGTTVASVGLGDAFGLIRWGGPRPSEGLQLDIVGSIFAQFELGNGSNDLINADYLIGLPLTFRRAGTSVRARLSHQSSHLGDEYLLRPSSVTRENLSFESVDLVLSQEIGPVRAYGGAEWLLRYEPSTLASRVFHGGLELRSGPARAARLVGAVDLKVRDRGGFATAVSGRAGVEFMRVGSRDHPGRPVSLLVDFYNGPSPYGQFFLDDVSFVGIGLHFGL